MAWLSRVNFIASDTLSFTDINNLGNDIRAWGDNVNGGGYTLSNVIVSAASGIMPVVTGGGAAGSTLTLRSTSVVGTTDAIIFQTGSQVDRGRIDTAGRWGIATTLPQTLLTVGSYAAGTGEATTRGYLQIQDPFEAATIDGSRGLEFKMSPAGSGFGWKIGTLAGNILCFGARQNSATFTEILRVTPQGNVAIGTQTPAASTALDITSTTGALLVPRMTTTQRNAMTATNGMILYNTTDNQMQARVNGAWVAL
jgi:hypothetical protein